MPGRDGTGPWGRGSMTGRGMGICRGYGYFGLNRSYRFGVNPFVATAKETDKDILEDEKEALKARLDEVERILKSKN